MSKRWNIFLTGYGIAVAFFTFWIVVLGVIRNEIIPYITTCSENNLCELTNLGALSVEILITTFVGLLILKIQKEHSESLAKVSRGITEKVYARKIDYYTIDVQFDELEKDDPEKAEKVVLEGSQMLVDLLVKQGKSTKDIEIPGRGKAKEIEFEKRILKITIPVVRRSCFTEGYAKSVNLHLRTDNFDLLNEVITQQKLRYWDLEWQLVGSYPVKSIMDKISENLGKTPGSSSMSSTPAQENIAYSATYGIIELNGIKIVARINPNSLGLTCQGRGIKQGFYRAHNLLSPEKIISILFGEVDFKEVKELLKNATEP